MAAPRPKPDLADFYHHRARVAALTRDRRPDDPELLAARLSMLAHSPNPKAAERIAALGGEPNVAATR